VGRNLILCAGAALIIVLLAPAPGNSAPTDCSYGAGAKAATLAVAPDDHVTLKVVAEAIEYQALASGPAFVPCGIATVTNTDSISVVGSGGNPSLWIDFSGGPFGPGAMPEANGTSEIEFDVNFSSSVFAGVSVFAGDSGSSVTAGTAGINLNGDDDADVALDGVAYLGLAGGKGKDILSGGGGLGTGDPTPLPLTVSGGYVIGGYDGADPAGDDVLTGGAGDDGIFAGLKSADVLNGGDGTDLLLLWGLGPSLTVNLQAGTITGDRDDAIVDIENVQGPPSGSTLIGDDHANQFADSAGDDIIDGRGGDDVVYAAGGADSITGGAGDDAIHIYQGSPTIDGQDGSDTVTASFGFLGKAAVSDTGGAGTDELAITDCVDVTVTADQARWGDETIDYAGIEVPPCGFSPSPPPAPPPPPSLPPPPPAPPPPPPAAVCTVPNVRGRTLAVARVALIRGNCAVGLITRRFSSAVARGRVIAQGTRPGTQLDYGTRVALMVSKGPRPLVKLCHKGRTIRVPTSQVRKHLRHGDKRGACRKPRRR
jgi:PASTA domain/RTX calcium-binding nonapeptide repeat (4 copies)